jgi:hypothetical protein
MKWLDLLGFNDGPYRFEKRLGHRPSNLADMHKALGCWRREAFFVGGLQTAGGACKES